MLIPPIHWVQELNVGVILLDAVGGAEEAEKFIDLKKIFFLIN